MYEVTRYKEYFKLNKGNCEGTYEMTSLEKAESYKTLKRMEYIRKLADNKDRAEREDVENRGICPYCHIVLPLSGECDVCGYTKPVTKLNISPDFQSRLAKVKASFTK